MQHNGPIIEVDYTDPLIRVAPVCKSGPREEIPGPAHHKREGLPPGGNDSSSIEQDQSVIPGRPPQPTQAL